MARVKRTHTSKVTKTQRVASIIADNAGEFKRGTSIDQKTFIKLFKDEYPAIATADIKNRIESRAFLSVQSAVNRVLAHAGRAIKWTDKDEFLNISKEGTVRKVAVMREKAQNQLAASAILQDGFSLRGNKHAKSMRAIVDKNDMPNATVKASAKITSYGPGKIYARVETYLDADRIIAINDYE